MDMTRSQFNHSYESGKWIKVKVAKCCWKKWNGPFLMHIYDKQCEIMQKNQWKGPNFQIQCFYNERSLTDRSSLLKTPKTRKIKTHLTQNFELVWPIQGRTMWKLTSWGFQKCDSFRDLEILKQSYGPPKSTQISVLKKAEMVRWKKKTRPQFSKFRLQIESAWN